MTKSKESFFNEPRTFFFIALILTGIFLMAFLYLRFAPSAGATFHWTQWSSCQVRQNHDGLWRYRQCNLGGSGAGCSFNQWGDKQWQECEVEPTPTLQPTPTATPSATPTVEPTRQPEPTTVPQPLSEPTPQGAPVCTAGNTLLLPANFHVIRDRGEAVLKWVPTEGGQVNIYYKENGQPGWTHAKADQPNNGYNVVESLNPSLGYTFGLQQKNSCGGGQLATSVVIDPPSNGQIFRFSFWTW